MIINLILHFLIIILFQNDEPKNSPEAEPLDGSQVENVECKSESTETAAIEITGETYESTINDTDDYYENDDYNEDNDYHVDDDYESEEDNENHQSDEEYFQDSSFNFNDEKSNNLNVHMRNRKKRFVEE